ncbi:hypothetical protein [Celeribacter persicus]|uniref:Uncharacterized protein n=1 Tax=Celeribacter persicus TaxID=1651082 RepID=A0A2T5HGU5_9RHOB|nr:hypothetical protein [Celeribacter persicus]PTQ70784.1 hypothetical protein C8N42_109113 [Celeribacter persicus]
MSLLAYLHYSHMQAETREAVAQNVVISDSYVRRKAQEDELPTLSTMRVAAPKNGSEARSFEIEHVDETAGTGQIVWDDGTGEMAEYSAEPEVPEVPGPPEDAGIGELAMYYFERLSAWLFGEREETIEMDCKTKRDGGKVCSVTRG